MDKHVYKEHNKSLLLYHVVCPARYRREVFGVGVEETIKEICLEIEKRYEIGFIEIGVDRDHVHFLIQSVPMELPKNIVQRVKSITAREIFKKHKEVKKKLWGGRFWTSGYYINTVGRYGNEKVIAEYVRKQGIKYKKIYRGQLRFFEGV